MHLDLFFPVLGSTLPSDHGYALYSALSDALPAVHNGAVPLAIAPVRGQYADRGLLQLEPRRARLRLRLPAEAIPTVLPLAGRSLNIASHTIRLGVPQVQALIPAAALIARMVTIKRSDRRDRSRTKDYMEPAAFLEGIRRDLVRLGIHGEPGIPLVTSGPHAGRPCRRVLRIKNRRVVGFALQVTALTAEESIRLQETGLGGRRKMGCGFFMPLVAREDRP